MGCWKHTERGRGRGGRLRGGGKGRGRRRGREGKNEAAIAGSYVIIHN